MLKYVGIHINVSEFDVSDGVCLSVTSALDEYVTPCLQTVTTMLYLTLCYSESLVDDRFFRVNMLRGNIIERGIGFCHALCCDVK